MKKAILVVLAATVALSALPAEAAAARQKAAKARAARPAATAPVVAAPKPAVTPAPTPTATATVAATTPVVAPAAAAVAAAPYSTSKTPIGELLDNPATKAVLVKHIPALATNPQIEMARGFTLKQVQSYAAGMMTDELLAMVDADLATIAK